MMQKPHHLHQAQQAHISIRSSCVLLYMSGQGKAGQGRAGGGVHGLSCTLYALTAACSPMLTCHACPHASCMARHGVPRKHVPLIFNRSCQLIHIGVAQAACRFLK